MGFARFGKRASERASGDLDMGDGAGELSLFVAMRTDERGEGGVCIGWLVGSVLVRSFCARVGLAVGGYRRCGEREGGKGWFLGVERARGVRCGR